MNNALSNYRLFWVPLFLLLFHLGPVEAQQEEASPESLPGLWRRIATLCGEVSEEQMLQALSDQEVSRDPRKMTLLIPEDLESYAITSFYRCLSSCKPRGENKGTLTQEGSNLYFYSRHNSTNFGWGMMGFTNMTYKIHQGILVVTNTEKYTSKCASESISALFIPEPTS